MLFTNIVVIVALVLISWNIAVMIARIFFNATRSKVSFFRGEPKRLDNILVFWVAALSCLCITALLEFAVIRIFPNLDTYFWRNFRVILVSATFLGMFLVQILIDMKRYDKMIDKMIESGEMEKLIEEAKAELEEEHRSMSSRSKK